VKSPGPGGRGGRGAQGPIVVNKIFKNMRELHIDSGLRRCNFAAEFARDFLQGSVIIMLDKRTKYLKDDQPATKADLKVGVRVVIDANVDAKTKMYTAAEIKIGTPDDTAPKK
jgi:hypothetical protein